MIDEPAEYGTDRESFDPIDPKLGHYYLYDELRKRIHVSVFGKSEFATWERARFVRSCSTMWPFLRIRKVWLGIGFKEQAQSKVMERRKIENVLFDGGIKL